MSFDFSFNMLFISNFLFNRIDGVMVNMLASSAVDHGFKPQSGQTKNYKIGICCFSAKHAALRRKSTDWLCPSEATCPSMECCFSELAL
jgi:hypothetical protein